MVSSNLVHLDPCPPHPEHRPLSAARTRNTRGSIAARLDDIIEQRNLTALFQPILDLQGGAFIGFEGLIRGPVDGPLHSPIDLFSAAKEHGLSLEIEMLCRQIVLEGYARQKLPGKLFLNVSPEALADPSFKNGQTLGYMKQLDILPEQVVIEITENQPTLNFQAMHDALLHYRGMGFNIAVDDLGSGFSSLRVWFDLRPEFVKIDMHFVRGVDADPQKLQFLKSVQQIAESCGSHVIAEGVETEAELTAVRDIGIALGQGYFIARPTPAPPLLASPEVSRIISSPNISVYPEIVLRAHYTATVQKLMVYIEPVRPETRNSTIFKRFSEDTALRSIPVVRDGIPVGLITRYSFIDRFVQPFSRELLGKKPCTKIMHNQPLLVEKDMSISELSHLLVESESRHFTDGFIITEQGKYAGLATGQDLLRAVNQMQIETARYANPLTLLPGNVPINEHIERLLHASITFHVCYCDLDNFKPYNDVYGYRKGDEMIQLTSRILNWACDPKLDFIGHIGGDDFILLMQSHDWKSRCEQVLREFTAASSLLITESHRQAGGYMSEDRRGEQVFHPFPTLSIGAACIQVGQFKLHHEVSAAATEAKRMAKRAGGNTLFIEQRSKHSG